MALLHLLATLAPDLGITMIVGHADHGLRPDAADTEANMVRQASTSLGLDCHVSQLNVSPYARNNGISTEEAARNLRYSFFDTLSKDTGANKIVVAHTADDQSEEILLRLIRGTGRKGLSGMALLRDGRVVRPLLTIEKNRLIQYLNDKGIPFATDASNTDRRYLRNRIRLDLLPYLATFNPNISQTLRQTAAILQEEDTLLDTMAQDWYCRLVSENTLAELPSAIIKRTDFNTLPIAIARRILEKMLIHMHTKPRYKHIESLMALASQGSGQIHLSHGLRAIASTNALQLFYPWGKKSCRAPLVNTGCSFSLRIEGPGRYTIAETGARILVESLSQRTNSDSIKNDPADFFDAAKISFPLTIRNQLPNDKLCPLGGNSNNTKKVSAILSAKKIPHQQRHTVPIATCNNQIIAILGFCIDDHVKITDSTTTLLKITVITTERNSALPLAR
ncbi:MAG: tRNA lysidine(34) synthetase TilS [Proteobacteria bacterium]|nr:tRNA lysidine(34) synthetase TilS [Pseudomonadota bacterium]